MDSRIPPCLFIFGAIVDTRIRPNGDLFSPTGDFPVEGQRPINVSPTESVP